MLLEYDVTRRDTLSVVMDAGSRIVNFIRDGTAFGWPWNLQHWCACAVVPREPASVTTERKWRTASNSVRTLQKSDATFLEHKARTTKITPHPWIWFTNYCTVTQPCVFGYGECKTQVCMNQHWDLHVRPCATSWLLQNFLVPMTSLQSICTVICTEGSYCNVYRGSTVRAPVFGRHQFFGTSEHYGKAHGSLLSGWMNYDYTACCWFPTSSNILIPPSQFWQIRFEICWLHCSKCQILVLLRYLIFS